MDIKIICEGYEIPLNTPALLAFLGLVIDTHSALTNTNSVKNAELLLKLVKKANEELGEYEIA